MKILSANVENFGSYERLEFDFQDRGLTLLAGPTGAGKSTLCDVVPWVLFGITAKNGAVDDVRAWGITEETRGYLTVQVGTAVIVVKRSRGKTNDLVFVRDEGVPTRGKDLLDTQRLLNEVLGMTPELYLAGAYFHEFSQTASFFTAPAKVRRLITEQLVDLNLAKTLTEKIANAKKDVKGRTSEADKLLIEARTIFDSTKKHLADTKLRAVEWTKSQGAKIIKVEHAAAFFDSNKRKLLQDLHEESVGFEARRLNNIARYKEEIEELSLQAQGENKIHAQWEALKARRAGLTEEKCETCGSKKDSGHLLHMMSEEHGIKNVLAEIANAKRGMANAKKLLELETKAVNPFTKQIEAEEQRANTYTDQVKALKKEKNPHDTVVANLEGSIVHHTNDLNTLQDIRDDLRVEATDLDTLNDVVGQFRGAIVKRAIKDLEQKTNNLLDKHFDAELRVGFDIAQADKLEVEITKDGNNCSYSQLSKGQRQLLKLCFGVSVMKVVALHHAVQFDAIFLDEFADGLDESMKSKAFGLLQELSLDYGSVFAIDHSEGLKAMFDNRVDVKLVDGRSTVEQS